MKKEGKTKKQNLRFNGETAWGMIARDRFTWSRSVFLAAFGEVDK